MTLIFHIFVAILSLAQTAYMFFIPSKTKLRLSYGLTGLTLLSGVYLVFSTGTHMVQACITGLTFVGISLAGIIYTQRRLAEASS